MKRSRRGGSRAGLVCRIARRRTGNLHRGFRRHRSAGADAAATAVHPVQVREASMDELAPRRAPSPTAASTGPNSTAPRTCAPPSWPARSTGQVQRRQPDRVQADRLGLRGHAAALGHHRRWGLDRRVVGRGRPARAELHRRQAGGRQRHRCQAGPLRAAPGEPARAALGQASLRDADLRGAGSKGSTPGSSTSPAPGSRSSRRLPSPSTWSPDRLSAPPAVAAERSKPGWQDERGDGDDSGRQGDPGEYQGRARATRRRAGRPGSGAGPGHRPGRR